MLGTPHILMQCTLLECASRTLTRVIDEGSRAAEIIAQPCGFEMQKSSTELRWPYASMSDASCYGETNTSDMRSEIAPYGAVACQCQAFGAERTRQRFDVVVIVLRAHQSSKQQLFSGSGSGSCAAMVLAHRRTPTRPPVTPRSLAPLLSSYPPTPILVHHTSPFVGLRNISPAVSFPAFVTRCWYLRPAFGVFVRSCNLPSSSVRVQNLLPPAAHRRGLSCRTRLHITSTFATSTTRGLSIVAFSDTRTQSPFAAPFHLTTSPTFAQRSKELHHRIHRRVAAQSFHHPFEDRTLLAATHYHTHLQSTRHLRIIPFSCALTLLSL